MLLCRIKKVPSLGIYLQMEDKTEQYNNRLKSLITKTRIFAVYYKKSQTLNIVFSLLTAAVVGGIGYNYLLSFWISTMTGGYLLSVYLYELRYKQQYYFYFNKGFSRRELLLCTYILNGVLLAVITFIITRILWLRSIH